MAKTTILKLCTAACMLAAANAYAFYGTEIENYKPNPWLERPTADGRQASSAAGTTRPSSEATREKASRDDLIERLWRESARTSSQYGA